MFSRKEKLSRMKEILAKETKRPYTIIEEKDNFLIIGFNGEGQKICVYHSNDIGLYANVFINVGSEYANVNVSIRELETLLKNNVLCDSR